MTILEYLRTTDVNTIVDEIMASFDREKATVNPIAQEISYALDFDQYFMSETDCPMECNYLEQDNSYEDEWMNGMCTRYDEECPYKIDRNEVLKRLLKEFFTKDF